MQAERRSYPRARLFPNKRSLRIVTIATIVATSASFLKYVRLTGSHSAQLAFVSLPVTWASRRVWLRSETGVELDSVSRRCSEHDAEAADRAALERIQSAVSASVDDSLLWIPLPERNASLPTVEEGSGHEVLPVLLVDDVYLPGADVALNIYDHSEELRLYESLLLKGARRVVAALRRRGDLPPGAGGIAALAPVTDVSAYGVVLYLENLRDVSAATDGMVKYVAEHRVLGRARLHGLTSMTVSSASATNQASSPDEGTLEDDVGETQEKATSLGRLANAGESCFEGVVEAMDEEEQETDRDTHGAVQRTVQEEDSTSVWQRLAGKLETLSGVRARRWGGQAIPPPTPLAPSLASLQRLPEALRSLQGDWRAKSGAVMRIDGDAVKGIGRLGLDGDELVLRFGKDALGRDREYRASLVANNDDAAAQLGDEQEEALEWSDGDRWTRASRPAPLFFEPDGTAGLLWRAARWWRDTVAKQAEIRLGAAGFITAEQALAAEKGIEETVSTNLEPIQAIAEATQMRWEEVLAPSLRLLQAEPRDGARAKVLCSIMDTEITRLQLELTLASEAQ